MLQHIITALILLAALVYVGYLLWEKFRPNKKSACDGCSGCDFDPGSSACGGCELKNLKQFKSDKSKANR